MEALERSPSSIDARLAAAMLDWQTVEEYKQAEQAFRTLRDEAPNHWQIHHQYGLLQLATGRIEEALDSFRRAMLRNPLSVTVKIDRARAIWFAGDVQQALSEATRVRDKYNRDPLAIGLLVDIYEQQGLFEQAAAEHKTFDIDVPGGYFFERANHLRRLPYGPFGDELNDAIWQARLPTGIDDAAFAELVDPLPPMLSLVLAMHPSFHSARVA